MITMIFSTEKETEQVVLKLLRDGYDFRVIGRKAIVILG